MGWQDLVDSYEWKARLIPTVIVLLPGFVTTYFLYPGIVTNPVLAAGSGLVSIAVIYLAAMLVRHLGSTYQESAWRAWGGPPSTRYLRMRDSFFSDDQKYRLQVALTERFGVRLVSRESEAKNPDLADKTIMDAFKEVKEFLRKSGEASLVDKHNAEYGFTRNLCGSRWVFAALAITGFLLCGFTTTERAWDLTPGASVNLILLVIWVPLAWFVLPGMLKRNAETYAERAWLTFLARSER